MNGKTEKLRGRSRLVGAGVDTDTSYELLVMTEAVDVGHYGNAAQIDGFKQITGRLKFSNSVHPPIGEKLTLILEDGRKLAVLVQPDGSVTATSDFFK